jgi:hypothetical protein
MILPALKAEFDAFATRYGIEAARRVVFWRGYCNSNRIEDVAPSDYATLVQAFRYVASGALRLPSYDPAVRPRKRMSSWIGER